jgi:hypothetical protein
LRPDVRQCSARLLLDGPDGICWDSAGCQKRVSTLPSKVSTAARAITRPLVKKELP